MTSSVSANPASQLLSALLSQLSASSSSSSSTTASTMTMAMAQVVPTTGSTSCNALTGSSTAGLTSETLDALMALQQLDGTSSSTSSSSTSDPVQQLFSAMDTNGDGTVSQSEMESYIEGVGGTQTQADALYNAINQNGSSASGSTSGITESQMASAASPSQQTQAAQGGHHHHHHAHGAGGNQADNVANSLLQALDTNDDGSVSESEFSNFVTANGGTATQAASDFSALDTSGSGSLTSADFATAWSNLQAQQTSQSSGTMVVSLLDAFAKANTTTSSTTSISA
jgi:Ca2+-binding EF-hand superfamily protein